MKLISTFMLFFTITSFVFSQDMPPLPPMNNQAAVSADSNTSAPALPPLPDQPGAASSASSSPALPPLPGQPAAPASGSPALPPLPDQAAPANKASPAMPPLPGQPAAAPAGTASPEMPPLPGQAAAPAAPGSAEATGTPAETTAETKPAKKTAQPWWTKTKDRPNVIFGGWVKSKGGNESSRIAWTSQEVLNALLFKGYKVVKEDGKYDGQEGAGGHQWREITFSVPKSKMTTQVYVKQVGKKVFLRVGPSEPPAFAEYSIAQVAKMRDANLKALRLVQKKLGRRLSPHHIVRSFEAPYSFAKDAVVE